MKSSLIFLAFIFIQFHSLSQTVEIDMSKTYQTIEGFGAHQGDTQVNEKWWQDLFFDDMGCSIYRVDLTPKLVSPYSDLSYYSPWFMGSQIVSIFNLEDPANPNGPEGNRVRTYTGPNDYSRLFGGKNAPIAVMGPDIEQNITKFKYSEDEAITKGNILKGELGDFKLIGSIWSPLPWVKISSGNSYPDNWWPGPVIGSKWPFIWGGNFAGGKLDISDTPLDVFNDSSLGGTGKTSSLTQFARSTAAYIKGYQDYFNTKFYAVSIQNELNFEQFYNSATYPLSAQYIAAVKAVKSEFLKYDDLKDILIMGPEDLLGGDSYGLWEYGSSQGPIHKNLQYLKNIESDPTASASVDFYCVHGYDANGVSSSGANSTNWERWANGWTTSPAPGIPSNVQGFNFYGKKSWMTETSGESDAWLAPSGVFPNNGGWSIALKIHQALTAGNESAWIYWTFSGDESEQQAGDFALTTKLQGANGPKYNGAKHFFKYIRPGSMRTDISTLNVNDVAVSSFKNIQDSSYTMVFINQSDSQKMVDVDLKNTEFEVPIFDKYTSSENNYWQKSQTENLNNKLNLVIPAFGVSTITGKGVKTTSTFSNSLSKSYLVCHPNPAFNQTNITYFLNKDQKITILVQDVNGKTFRILDVNSYLGENSVMLDINDLQEGIYSVVLKTEDDLLIKKLVINK